MSDTPHDEESRPADVEAKLEAERASLAEVTDDDIKRLLADIGPGLYGSSHLAKVACMWLKRDFVRLNDADPETVDLDRAEAFTRFVDLLAPSLAESTGRPLEACQDELSSAVRDALAEFSDSDGS